MVAAPLVLPTARMTIDVASGDPWLVGPSPGADKDVVFQNTEPMITMLVSRDPGACINKIVDRMADLKAGRAQVAELPAQVPTAWFPIELSVTAPNAARTPVKIVCRDLRQGSISIGALSTGAFDLEFWTRSAPLFAGIEAQFAASGEPPKTYDVTGPVMLQRIRDQTRVATAPLASSPGVPTTVASQLPLRPAVRRSLTDQLVAQFSVSASAARIDASATTMRPAEDASAIGVQAGFEGSLYTLATGGFRPHQPGFRIRDSWTAGVGAGYSTVDESAGWFTFRLEAALRPVYKVSDDLDVFSRIGYLVGYDSNRQVGCVFSGSGCKGFDNYLVTAGARASKLFAEVGYGPPRNENSGHSGYRFATLQYRVRDTGLFKYVGLHYEGTASDSESDPSTNSVRLVFASH